MGFEYVSLEPMVQNTAYWSRDLATNTTIPKSVPRYKYLQYMFLILQLLYLTSMLIRTTTKMTTILFMRLTSGKFPKVTEI